jgi:hypothetical protein
VGTAGAQQVDGQTKSADDLELEQRVIGLQPFASSKTDQSESGKVSLKNLQSFWSLNQKENLSCQDSRKVLFAEKYVLTYDSAGNPCRIYDLSFPNFSALTAKKQLLQVPVRNLTSRDFLDALDQNWGAIQNRNREFASRFNPRVVSRNSFVGKLKFKSSRLGAALPMQFTLADLELQKPFVLNESLKADLKNLVQRLESRGTNSLYQQLAENPELLLKAVKFEWSDLDKVYNVILDGRFLPFSGPVEVLNFQEQYRAPVEKLTRQVLGDILAQMARLIPNPTIQSVVEVVIDDVFEQIELLYTYQNLRLESVLLNLKNSSLKPTDFQTLTVRASNILYGQKSDFITSYILAAVQGQKFDWLAIEKMGPASKYNVEKQRKIMMSKMHSRLVLETGCETQIVSDYFAICQKGGKKVSAHSLISEQSIPFKSFGAPKIYDYQRPSAVSLTRGSLWILSAGLRIVGLPLSRNITNTLDGYLKGYMQSGIKDEALLQSSLLRQSYREELTAESNLMLNWLYIQNLNPFLPKSLKGEMKFVEMNKNLIGQFEEQK